MKKALVINHLAFEDLGNLAEVLQKRGFSIEQLEVGIASFKDCHALQADLLIILGGPIAVYQTDTYPFLIDEIDFISQRLKNNLPTLGICLGAQLIAHALGAKVYPGPSKEIGWSGLQLTPLAQQSYFEYLDAQYTQVLHWHGDTFDLPDQAKLLASTLPYTNQAFSVGKNILGLQFHLEVMPQTIERWFIGHSCELEHSAGLNIQQLRQDSQFHAKILMQQAQKFWHGWLDTL